MAHNLKTVEFPMTIFTIIRTLIFKDYVFQTGITGVLLSFIPHFFLFDVSLFGVAIQVISAFGGVLLLIISVWVKVIEAQRTYIKYLKEKKEYEKE